jgi:hypothetical protein
VLGVARTGAYGGIQQLKRLFDAHKIAWGWQTLAWSAGQWEPRAQLRQVRTGLTAPVGGPYDIDEAQVADFGQWHPPQASLQGADGAATDFDGDGRPHLVATWTSGTLTAYLNTGAPGAPGFATQMDIDAGWNNILRILVIDADNDGKRDLLGVWTGGKLSAYLNTSTPGHPSFATRVDDIGTGFDALTKIAVIDADNDGKPDLVGVWPDGTLTAYLNTGTPGHPAFGTQMNIGAGWNGLTQIVVVDADNDGKPDLVGTWANGTLTAYRNTGTPGHPGFGTQKDIGSGWQDINRIDTVH